VRREQCHVRWKIRVHDRDEQMRTVGDIGEIHPLESKSEDEHERCRPWEAAAKGDSVSSAHGALPLSQAPVRFALWARW
jgi:hypothetical protein